MRAIEAIEKASAQNDVKGPSFLSLILPCSVLPGNFYHFALTARTIVNRGILANQESRLNTICF